MKAVFGWLVVLLFIGVLIAGFFLLQKVSSGAQPSFSFATSTMWDFVSPTSSPRTIPAGFKEYRNEQFGFSVLYPESIPPKEFVDRGPELTVAFQNSEGSAGFQIYVAPIDGTQISQERFLRDAPSGVRRNPTDTSIAGAQAVAFDGFDARVGDTREVWFIHTKPGRAVPTFLYEVTTYKELGKDLEQILGTWQFI